MRLEKQTDEKPSYDELFIRFSKRVEKGLVTAVIALLVCCIAAQTILQIPYFRYWLVKVERLEGQPYIGPEKG